MHTHSIMVWVLMMIMLTAGFIICELNYRDLHEIWDKLKRFIKVRH